VRSFIYFYPIYEHNHPICDNIIQNGLGGMFNMSISSMEKKKKKVYFIFEDHPYTIFFGGGGLKLGFIESRAKEQDN